MQQSEPQLFAESSFVFQITLEACMEAGRKSYSSSHLIDRGWFVSLAA